MLVTRLDKGQHRSAMLTLLVLIAIAVSACSSDVSDEIAKDVTEGAVDRAWTEAAECLTNEGYSVEKEKLGMYWSVVFDGVPEETSEFLDLYDGCVDEAEAINRAFLRTQIPEGAERLELAAEFQTCLAAAGVKNPVAYDPNNPDQPTVLADAQTQLGYALDDPAVVEDPRFGAVQQCLQTYELLFPHRFEGN